MSSNYSLGGVGGFNSGFDVNTIISQLMAMEQRPIDLMSQKKSVVNKQQAAFTSIQNKTRSLLTSISTLTSRDIVTKKTLFEQMKATSSDTKSVSASVSNSAAAQTLNVEVLALPTSTIATSLNPIGRFDPDMTIDDLSSISDRDVKPGKFTMYTTTNGVTTATDIQVNLTDKVDDVLTAIKNAIPGATNSTVTIVDGKIKIDYSHAGGPDQVTFGSGADTSDFLAKTFLNTAINNGSKVITASQPVSTVDRDAAVTTDAANLGTTVTEGSKFKINGVEFSAQGKSLNTLIDEINSSAAGVTANFNRGTNKFELVSKNPGNALINLEDIPFDNPQPGDPPSNFLAAMGLVNGSGSSASQVAGTNAHFKINGVEMYSASSTVDENITGITGVTLSLKKVAVGTTTQITIQNDTDAVINQVADIIDKYNAVIDEIAKQTKIDPEAKNSGDTANNGPLAGNSTIKNFRNQLRGLFTQSVGGALANTAYGSLQMVGISSSAKPIGSSTTETTDTTDGETTDTTKSTTTDTSSSTPTVDGKLYLDKAALRAALADDPASLKKLFMGVNLPGTTTAGDDGLDGTFTKIQRLISDKTYTDSSGKTGFGALYNLNDGAKGLFASYQDSANKRIKALTDSIQRATDRLALKEKTLRQQYLAMDKMVGQYKQQGAALSSIQTYN